MKQLIVAILLIPALCRAGTDNSVSLAGKWRFELDRSDAGIQQRWFTRRLPDKIELPGSLPAQGIGDDITTNTPWVGGVKQSPWFTAPEYAKYRQPGNVKVPFWLQPEKYYKGVAWYQRDLEIPKSWKGKRIVLSLERPHWETSVWLDDNFIGTNISLSTPHEYDLGQLAPGKHTLTIRVDNRMIIDIGENSHAISDHTQGDWNGVVGKIELRATPLVWLEDVQVYPNIETKSALVKVRIGNETGRAGQGSIEVGVRTSAWPGNRLKRELQPVTWDAGGGSAEIEIPLGDDAQLWDEFHPALYELTATLETSQPVTCHSSLVTVFGLREISTDGTQFLINGRKTFIRGTLECCVFPKTGHPPTDVASWKRVIRIAKSYGLNLLRFHSYCPPDAAFEAADELGMYLQVETCWANQSTTLGDGKPVDAWVYRETARILNAYGNHPSFVLMPYGNEPGGKNATAYLEKYVAHFKALEPRRLWTSASGWPQIPENQFDVTPDPRIQAWGAGLKSRINADPPATTNDYRDYIERRPVPVISHEIGQWCAYPDFAEMPQYTGYLKPKNFEIFRDTLDANGMGNLPHQFLLASGKLQALCYKDDIESALRTPGMGGFELLGLNDFPGQGTALVGVLGPFWDNKGYVTARGWRHFCNTVVPLARLPKRVFTTDDKLEADLEVANFGPCPLTNVVTDWNLVQADGKVFARGELPAKTIPLDNGIPLGRVSVGLKNEPAPAEFKLAVRLAGTEFENNWRVWVYPAQLPPAPTNILVTDTFDTKAQDYLKAGGKVLLTIPGNEVRNYKKDPVKLGFSSIFWNTAWTARQAPTTLGILCDPKNPALAEFPSQFYSDWQWWSLIHRAGALRLDVLPKGVKPIVRVIDDWVTAHPLALILEGKLGAGRIVVCGFDLTRGADDPVSRQMRASLFDYMNSKEFAPKIKLTADEISNLIASPRATQGIEVNSIKADSEENGYEAANAIDGDPSTIWHTNWSDGVKPHPHELMLEFKKPIALRGVTVLPRRDGNHHGWIKDYECYTSADGTNWVAPVAKGTFADNDSLKTVLFGKTVNARFIRFVALSGFGSDTYTSIAEFSALKK